MFEFVSLVLTLLLADLYPLGGEPVFYSPWLTAAGAAAIPVALGALARFLLRRAGRRLDAHADLSRYATEIHRTNLALRALLLCAYAGLVYLLHWPLFVNHSLGLGGVLIVDRVAMLLPVLLGLVTYWAAAHPADVRLRGSTWSLGKFLEFRARTSAGTVLAPILLLSAAIEGLMRVPAIERSMVTWPFVEWLVYAASVFLLYVFAPLLLRAVWRAEPLPAGPLRAELEAVQRRAGFRCRDLLIWRTGGGRIANALVIGLMARLRYVIFTDTLLERLSPAEVGAVLGHEIGHARHHHLAWYFGFSLCLVLTLTWAQSMLAPYLTPTRLGATFAELAGGALTLSVLGAMGAAFGYVSRRFERQADVAGAEITGDPIVFATTLEKIGVMNGIPRHLETWRYFSIAQRVQDVLAAASLPGMRERFHRSSRAVMLALGMFFALSVAGAVQVAAGQGEQAAERLSQYRGLALARAAERSLNDGRPELAREEMEAALREDGGRADFHVLYGEILARLGDHAAARAAYGRARELPTTNSWVRIRLAEEETR